MQSSTTVHPTLLLRDVVDDDLSAFFEHHCDLEANCMAAFTAKDPGDRAAFLARWERIRLSATVMVRTIVFDGAVGGHVMSYEEDGRCEVTFWLGKQYWGRGIATRALAEFLVAVNRARPIYARAAKDNTRSLRVLQKCGFTVVGEEKGFANARGKEIEEFFLELQEKSNQ